MKMRLATRQTQMGSIFKSNFSFMSEEGQIQPSSSDFYT